MNLPSPLEPAPTASPFDIPLHTLRLSDPLRWLRLGWQDFAAAPRIGLFYGAVFAGMGWLLLMAFRHAPAWVLALSAGFLLLAPALCLGLYRASQQRAQGVAPTLADSLFAWETRTMQLAIFAFVLLVLEMLWARATLIVFALAFDGMPDFKGSLLELLAPRHWGFVIGWLGVGAVFAGLIYAISVVAMPMLLDRPVDAITAGLTSLRLVLTQTPVMLLWGALIALLTVLALLPGFLGLLVVAPVIGHASWHAYRAAVGD